MCIRDRSTVVYCSWGELDNSAANGTAGIDYRLPYGLYTVIELNPYEGREPDMFEVFIGRDPEAEPATAPTETKSGSGEDYPYTSGWYDFNYNYILENKTLKQTVTVCKTDAPVSYTHLDVYKRQGTKRFCLSRLRKNNRASEKRNLLRHTTLQQMLFGIS